MGTRLSSIHRSDEKQEHRRNLCEKKFRELKNFIHVFKRLTCEIFLKLKFKKLILNFIRQFGKDQSTKNLFVIFHFSH